MGLRGLARRCRGHLAALALVLALGGAITLHHTGVGAVDAHRGMDAALVVETCLGAFAAVGAAVVAVAFGLVALGRWRPPADRLPVGVVTAVRGPEPRARPGPALLCLLCIRRR